MQAFNQSGKAFKIITIPDKMPDEIFKHKKLLIGFDPMLITKQTLKRIFKSNNIKLKPISRNLVDEIWKRKVKVNNNKFYKLPKKII